jgi:hypothetical protein
VPKYLIAIFLAFLFCDLIILNIFGYFNYVDLKEKQVHVPENAKEQPAPIVSDTCGADCQKYIDSKINLVVSSFPTSAPTQKVVVASQKSKVRSTSYVPVPGSGSTTANNWVDITGTDFYFDTGDYPGLVSIYFETNFHLFNGNGTAFIRLFDVTHGVGVQGSEVQVSKQADTAVVSGLVSFYKSKNLIRIQAKSLTADTTVFTFARLKITTEN